MKVYQQLGDDAGRAKAYFNIGICYVNMGQKSKGITAWKVALELRRQENDNAGQAVILQRLGNQYGKIPGSDSEAEAAYAKAAELHRKMNNTMSEGDNLAALAQVYQRQLRLDKAESTQKLVLDLCIQAKDHRRAGTTALGLGRMYSDWDRLPEAEEVFTSTLESFRKVGHELPRGVAVALVDLSIVYARQERYEKSVDAGRLALAAARKCESISDEANSLQCIASANMELGRLDEADVDIKLSVALSQQLKTAPERRVEGYAILQLGGLHAKRGDLDAAESSFHKALEIWRAAGWESAEDAEICLAQVHCKLGYLYSLRGDFDKAEEVVEKVLHIHRKNMHAYFARMDLQMLAKVKARRAEVEAKQISAPGSEEEVIG